MNEPLAKTRRGFAMGIRERLILWFVLGAVGAVVFGGLVVYISGLTTIQGTLGQTYCQIASRVVSQFENRVEMETAFIQGIATDVLTTEVALESYEIYHGRNAEWIAARNERLIREWRESPEGMGIDPPHPRLSRRLAVLARLKEGLVKSLFVVDLQGAIIGASDRPENRVILDQSWYLALRKKTEHFVFVDIGGMSGVLTIAAPIWGGVDIVGYVVGTYRHDQIVNVINDVKFGETGEAVLVDSSGIPLSESGQAFLERASAGRPANGVFGFLATEGTKREPYWVALAGDDNPFLWRRLVCVARTLSVNELRDRFQLPPWAIVVTQAPVESYAVLRNSLGFFALAGLVGIVIVGLGGAFIAWHITTPLRQLQEGVQRFARGVRDRAVEVSSADEIGELAAEFNRMAVRVSASENELKAFARAVADAADAIVLMAADGSVYYVNPSFEVVTGYDLSSVQGRTLSLLDGGAEREIQSRAEWSAMQSAIAKGRTWRGEVLARRRSGEGFPIDVSVSPIHGENDEVAALVAIFRDISLAREYQQSLEREVDARTREIADTQGLTVMGRMASMIAHDLRNALSTVKMNLQILFRRSELAEDGSRESCEMGLEQVRYMEEILRDMLSYAKPDRLQFDWHDVTPIIDETLAAFDHRFRENGITILRDDGHGLPKIFGDRVKVMAMLRNLVDNAVSAMPDGGALTISTHMVLSEDPTVQIAVADTGVGIASDVLPEVFEAFFTTRTRGTGLGLAIVKRIVEQHGGEVAIDSKQGKGTRVTLSLPTVSED